MKIDIRAAGSADIAQIADFNRRLAAESEGTDLDEAKITAGVATVI